MTIIQLIKKANDYDAVGNYLDADKLDILIEKIANTTHKDSSGIIWQNIGTPKEHGLIGSGIVWERQDTKARQIIPVGSLPDSRPKPQQVGAQTNPEQKPVEEKPVEDSSLFDDLYNYNWTEKVVKALN